MPAATLKKKAGTMFLPELATTVKAQITAAYKPSASAVVRAAAVANARSIATLWRSDKLYEDLELGKFEGRIQVVWNGIDTFVYRVDPEQPFSYTTSKKFTKRRIVPQLMDTDGGSIPRILRGLSKKFSSWGYAPAFIIHDWLFTAHKCKSAPDDDWHFADSAWIMAEAIKTLMVAGFTNYDGTTQKLPKAEDTLYLMYQGVASSIAEDLWNNKKSVRCRV